MRAIGPRGISWSGRTLPGDLQALKQDRRANAGREGTTHAQRVSEEPNDGDDHTTAAAAAPTSLIDQIVRDGARRMLAEALQAEVEGYIPSSSLSATRTAGGWWCATAATSRARCSPAPARWR
jgi:hypothetical protein